MSYPRRSSVLKAYVDDIYLCAFVADQVMKAAGNEDILTRNWDGKMQIISLVKEILSREEELIGDKRDRIMEFVGYDQLNNLALGDKQHI